MPKSFIGDRDMFVYREGFYRGTALSLFFLSAALLVRMFIPGASIQFAKGLFHISWLELSTTAAITCGIAYLFVMRYQRFAESRITRAVLAAIILQSRISQEEPTEAHGKTTLP